MLDVVEYSSLRQIFKRSGKALQSIEAAKWQHLHHTKENHKKENTRKDAVGGKGDEREGSKTVARGRTMRSIA
jgi:hypothetical protein